MTEEDEHEDDEDPCEEEEDNGGISGFAFRSPAPEPSSMVGLVCPRSGSWHAGLSFVQSKHNHKS